jgi:hypothetical protein
MVRLLVVYATSPSWVYVSRSMPETRLGESHSALTVSRTGGVDPGGRTGVRGRSAQRLRVRAAQRPARSGDRPRRIHLTCSRKVTGGFLRQDAAPKTPVVMGHQRCGAVTAAVSSLEDRKSLAANLDKIVMSISPAYGDAKAANPHANRQDLIEATTRRQIQLTVTALHADPLLGKNVGAGTLKIVGSYISLDSGIVEWLGQLRSGVVRALAEQRPGQSATAAREHDEEAAPTAPQWRVCGAGRHRGGVRPWTCAPPPAPRQTGRIRGSAPRGFPRSSTRRIS